MNFNLYIFGTPKGRYNQYPDDYIASTLTGIQDNTEGTRLVIHREMNLIHYVFSERIDKSNIIGFCLIFNKAYVQKPKQLIALFRYLIEKNLIESGQILKYSQDGVLQYNISAFSDNIKEYDRIKSALNREFDNNTSRYGISPLSTIYNGTKTTEYVGADATDAQILSVTSKCNTVIIDSKVGVAHGQIEQVMAYLRNENEKANMRINQLQNDITLLNRQKKQYRFVAILFLFLLGCGVGLFFLNDSLNATRNNLANANKTIDIQQDSLNNRQARINVLRENVKTLETRNRRLQSEKEDLESEKQSLQSQYDEECELRSELENKLSAVSSTHPLVVTSNTFNFSTGRFQFDYYGIQSKYVNLSIKAYGNGKSYESSGQLYVYSGRNNASIYLDKNLDNSVYYYFFLYADNKLIGAGRY